MGVVAETRRKLLAVECLQAMKKTRTFRSLSRELQLPLSVLNRYVNGHTLPRKDRAEQVLNAYGRQYLGKALSDSAAQGRYIVTADILSQPFLLSIIASRVAQWFPERMDKVLTAAADGIPLGVKVADALGAGCIYAKSTQEFTRSGYYTSAGSSKPLVIPLYLPRNLLRKGDSVLIVDDVIRGGTTFLSLTSICDQAKAKIAGVFSIYITREAYLRLKRSYKTRYLAMV